MPPPVSQRGSQRRGLCYRKNSTNAVETSSYRHRPSGGTLLQILPGASPPLPKFQTYPTPIYVWPNSTPQKPLDAAPHPRGCTPMGLWPPFPPPLKPPGIAQTVVSTVQERSHVRAPLTQCGKCKVSDECLNLTC